MTINKVENGILDFTAIVGVVQNNVASVHNLRIPMLKVIRAPLIRMISVNEKHIHVGDIWVVGVLGVSHNEADIVAHRILPEVSSQFLVVLWRDID